MSFREKVQTSLENRPRVSVQGLRSFLSPTAHPPRVGDASGSETPETLHALESALPVNRKLTDSPSVRIRALEARQAPFRLNG